jgi:phosphatidylinositol dimannoside acyltransferase
MLTEFLLVGSLNREELLERVTIDGLDQVDAALAKGHGAIMAVPHMGSWDMAGAYAGALGYRVSAVTERFPGSLNDAVVRTRQRFGLDVITMGRSAVRAIIRALEANAVVALLCDLE